MLHLDIYLKNYWETQSDEFSYVKYHEHFSEEEPCNIYMIGIRPRVIVEPSSLVKNARKISLKFKVQNGYDFENVSVDITLNRDVIGDLVVESAAPYSRFNLKDDAGYFYDKFLHSSTIAIEGKSMYALRQFSSLKTNIDKFNDLQILYIGKSLKMDKATSPVKRLNSHSKFQNILNMCTTKYFDKEVYVMLCSFVHKIPLVALSNELVENWEVLHEKLKKNIKILNPDTELITQIAEAMLIDYFDTKEFNKDFIGAFGRPTHTYFSRIKNSRITKVILEVDFRKICRVFSKTIPPKSHHYVEYLPELNYKKSIVNLPETSDL